MYEMEVNGSDLIGLVLKCFFKASYITKKQNRQTRTD